MDEPEDMVVPDCVAEGLALEDVALLLVLDDEVLLATVLEPFEVLVDPDADTELELLLEADDDEEVDPVDAEVTEVVEEVVDVTDVVACRILVVPT